MSFAIDSRSVSSWAMDLVPRTFLKVVAAKSLVELAKLDTYLTFH